MGSRPYVRPDNPIACPLSRGSRVQGRMPITPPTPPLALSASSRLGRTPRVFMSASPSRLKRTASLWASAPVLMFALLIPTYARAAVHPKRRAHKRTASRNWAVAHRKARRHRSKRAGGDRETSSPTTATSRSSATAAISSTSRRPSILTSSAKAGAAAAAGLVSTSAASSVTGSVLFDGTAITSWWLNQSAAASRVQTVPDPDGAANTAQQFTTYNTDVYPLTPTSNPRSQLDTPMTVLKPGNTYWESFEVYIPQNFTFLENGWVSLETAVYGYPYAGTPPAAISLESGDFRFQRNSHGPDPWQVAWSTPAVKGQWYRFTWHFLFSATGWVELYVNDVQQSLLQGTTLYKQLPINLLDASDYKGPWLSDEQIYYQLGMFPSATAYFKNYKIGTTQLAAES